MTIKLQNETKGEQEYIRQAHGEDETPDVVGHAIDTIVKSRLSSRGEDAAGEDGEGRIWV